MKLERMVICREVRPCSRSILLAFIALAAVLGLGSWGVTHLANPSSRFRGAGLGCTVASLTLLVLTNVILQISLHVSRQQHRTLLEALLPPQVLQSLNAQGGGAALFGRAAGGTDTPANLLLNMMGDLLAGNVPGLQDVLFIRTALMSNTDVYQPYNLRASIKSANLDADVAQSLMNQLGGGRAAAGSQFARGSSFTSHNQRAGKESIVPGAAMGSSSGAAALSASAASALSSEDVAGHLRKGKCNAHTDDPLDDFESLGNVLSLILTPQPAGWLELQSGASAIASLTAVEAKSKGDGKLLDSVARDLKTPQRAVVAMAVPVLQIPARLSPSPSAHTSPARGLLVKASSLLDRSRRRRRSSGVEVQPVVTDVTRSPLYIDPSASGPGTATRHSLLVDLSTGPQCTSQFIPTVTADSTATVLGEHVSMRNAIIGNVGGCTTGTDIDSTVTSTYGGDSFTGVVGTSSLSPQNPPYVEPLVPRRLSAVWSVLSMRGGHGSSRKASLDGNPALTLGSRASPAASSFSMIPGPSVRESSLTHMAAELLQTAQSRLGLGNGGGGGVGGGGLALSRTASVRLMAEVGSNTGISTSGAAAAAAAATIAAMKRSMTPPSSVIEEVERLLSCSDGWQFDTWALQEASGGHALSALGFYLMQRAGLIKVFRIQPVKLARLLRRLEAGYPDNPYHNAVHAADVLQTLHVIIHAAQLHVHYLDHLGLLAAYYAAIVHDYGHPGLTNDFLITTSDPLAVRYNDRSPLENHHCAASFGLLLQHPELDFLAGLPPQDRTSFRKMVIELVLSTDMKQHFSILSHFNTVHRLAAYSQQQPVAALSPVLKKQSKRILRRTDSRNLSGIHDTPDVQTSTTFAASWSEAAPKPVDETERLLSLQVALKAADIGHLGEDLVVHKRWLGVLEDEFFHQGDRERDLGLPISPLFDRSKQGVSKSQVGFYDFVALPLVHALSSAFPGAQPLMGCLVTNYNHWRTVEGQTTVEIPGVKDRGGGRRGNRGAHLSRSPSGRGGALTAGTEPSSHSQLEQSITSRDADRGGLPAVSRKSLFKAMSTSHERRQPSLRMQDALQPRLEGHDPPAIKLVLAQD